MLADFKISLNRWQSNLLLLCLILLGGLFFVPVLRGYWLADDFHWIHDFFRYDWGNIPKLFLGDWARAEAKEYGASLSRIIHGTTGPIYVVEWDNQQNAFVTRAFDQDKFIKGSYLASNGPLLRPHQSGQEAVLLP